MLKCLLVQRIIIYWLKVKLVRLLAAVVLGGLCSYGIMRLL